MSESITLPPNQDPTSVFYIHPSDTNVNQIVIVKFNGTAYNDWKRSMLIMLSTKNKLKFIDSTLDIPAPDSDKYILGVMQQSCFVLDSC